MVRPSDNSPATGSDLDRSTVIRHLERRLRADERIIAAYLAGSDASGRTDEASDIDLCVIVEDGLVTEALGIIEHALVELSPVRARYRLPEPTWHGHAQCFYALEGADPRHMIDLVIQERSAGGRLLERERHGEPLVVFDRSGLVRSESLDWPKHLERMRVHVAGIADRFVLFQPLVTKALDRGQTAEAVHFYMAVTWRPYLDLYRVIHCPERFDFGARYLDRDVPPEVRGELERLALAGSPDVLRRHHREIGMRFDETLECAMEALAELSARSGAQSGD